MVKLVSIDGSFFPPDCLKPDGKDSFFDHHFKSTDRDNLIELAGRVCYDSTKQIKTRSSEDYHNHINEVNHGSVQEHVNLTFSVTDEYSPTIPFICNNRPGVFITQSPEHTYRITANIRSIKEWDDHLNNITSRHNQIIVGDVFKYLAQKECPMSLSGVNISSDIDMINAFIKTFGVSLVKPTYDEEIWVSFYISNISRNLSHELVRHKFRTAVSQRSTRYVDESESDWAWHPLIIKYMDQNSIINLDSGWSINLKAYEKDGASDYKNIVKFLEDKLISEGVDKFAARKQSRGAARGVLGTCLSTEMIFSASIAQWNRMIKQRLSSAADAEIRLLFNQIYDILVEYGMVHQYNKIPSPDGVGYVFE